MALFSWVIVSPDSLILLQVVEGAVSEAQHVEESLISLSLSAILHIPQVVSVRDRGWEAWSATVVSGSARAQTCNLFPEGSLIASTALVSQVWREDFQDAISKESGFNQPIFMATSNPRRQSTTFKEC
mmetsp:Transcript_111337/g.221415  ORF Transcript_111337/g.221415 Transcript_111337/m.221415 type:complete len:128 (+) Transcript_111337:65-448(+)